MFKSQFNDLSLESQVFVSLLGLAPFVSGNDALRPRNEFD
ncbi:hypothetical protein SynRS9907_00544 [Synechococcus sp. RS9907]|nr:hypothetical protein SynRS9907_00544 [Synechococcus sp. RS9907]